MSGGYVWQPASLALAHWPGSRALASANASLGLEGADRAPVFIVTGFVAWLAAAAVRRQESWQWTFAPVGLVAGTIGAAVAAGSPGALTVALAAQTAGPLAAFVATRRWLMLGVADSFLVVTIWSAWRWAGQETDYLPAVLALLAVAQWVLLVPMRRYSTGETDAVIGYLSWAPWLAAAAIAAGTLATASQDPARTASLTRTDAWRISTVVLAMAAASLVAEGLRLRLRVVWMPGTAGLLCALLMAIAIAGPSNVQAYSAPVGLYLVGSGLTFRRSPPLFGERLLAHEAAMLVGAMVLVVPPSAQSFEPGGGTFGLEVLGIAIGLLLTGLILHARWLVPAGIVTLTAVSFRLVTGGLVSVPYWLLLGIAGTALLSLGVLVLLQRERWNRFRERAVEWWSTAYERPAGHGGTPSG